MSGSRYQGISIGIKLGWVVALATFIMIGLPAIGVAGILDGGVCEGVPSPCHSPAYLMTTVAATVVVVCGALFWLTKTIIERRSRD